MHTHTHRRIWTKCNFSNSSPIITHKRCNHNLTHTHTHAHLADVNLSSVGAQCLRVCILYKEMEYFPLNFVQTPLGAAHCTRMPLLLSSNSFGVRSPCVCGCVCVWHDVVVILYVICNMHAPCIQIYIYRPTARYRFLLCK